MDPIALSMTMMRLLAWLDRRCRPRSLVRKQFDGAPFGSSYATIHPRHQDAAASFNLNRVYFCGTDGGLDAEGVRRLTEMFTEAGVRRFFVWLCPGPDMDSVRGWLANRGFARNRWVKYPTLVHDGSAGPARVRTELDIREVSAAEVAAARDGLGEAMWRDYARSAGKSGSYHYLAFDCGRPVATAALYVFENLGYLAMASTAEGDRRRGAQQALIARRIAKARELGCAVVVSETLSMLEGSLRNLQRAGFREIYEKEVYEWDAAKASGAPKPDAQS
jgi:GNAT superfamily N-acetyltransferase